MAKKEEKIKMEGIAVPDWYLSLESEIIEVLALEAQVKSRKEKLQTTIHTLMEQEKIDCIQSDLTCTTRSRPTEVNRFDTNRFKDENPGLYESYCKIINRCGSVTFKWLKQPSIEAK